MATVRQRQLEFGEDLARTPDAVEIETINA